MNNTCYKSKLLAKKNWAVLIEKTAVFNFGRFGRGCQFRWRSTREMAVSRFQSNFHHNVSNGSIPLGKNGKALSKNKQKIQKYKRKRKQGTCFTCDSSEHQIAQCPIKKFLKSLKTNKSSFSKDFVNQEVCNRPTPCNYDGSSNGQCK